jgi:hypothetical protein
MKEEGEGEDFYADETEAGDNANAMKKKEKNKGSKKELA